MRLNKLSEAEHWYRESLRAKPDHIPAHLTYGKLLAMTVKLGPLPVISLSLPLIPVGLYFQIKANTCKKKRDSLLINLN